MQTPHKTNASVLKQAGFTLVELSIVLVIIGLIISSVLVGQDLVRGAELRATITQYESYNAAVGTFKGKYNGLPGDVTGATSFGFTGNGNADGSLLDSLTLSAGENSYFWSHLGSSGAALISGTYGGVAVDWTAASGAAAHIGSIVPAAKAGNYWGVYAASSVNYYALGIGGGSVAGDAAKYVSALTLTPLEAQNVDTKLDDGRPGKGIVQAKAAALTTVNDLEIAPTVTADGSSNCVSAATTAGTYNTKVTVAACNLRLKMPF